MSEKMNSNNDYPSGLVMYTNNRSQSHGETGELLTDDEIMAWHVPYQIEF